MSKFWDSFNKIFENMDEMFQHMDEEINSTKKEKKITKTIIKKVQSNDAVVHITLNGSATAINKITDQIIEIVNKYNEDIK